MQYPDRQHTALSWLQIDVELLRLYLPRPTGHGGEHGAAAPGDDVVDFELTEAELREVVVEPPSQRCVHIDNRAVGLGGEEPGGGVVEKVNRVLKVLEESLVAFMFARLI